eukprot:151513_1
MESPTGIYNWSLNTKSATKSNHPSCGSYYDSPSFRMFGLVWRLSYYTDFFGKGKGGIFLYLVIIPDTLSKMQIARMITVAEINHVNNATTTYDKDNLNWGTTKTHPIPSADVSTLTIKIGMELINIYDNNGKDIFSTYTIPYRKSARNNEQKNDDKTFSSDITNQIQMHSERIDSMATQIENITKNMTNMQKTLKDIQLQMTEEKKNNNYDVSKEIEEIKNNMKMLLSNKNNDNVMDKNKQDFKNWVQTILKLPQLYDVFVENGIETLNIAQLITKDELNEMGITKIG